MTPSAKRKPAPEPEPAEATSEETPETPEATPEADPAAEAQAQADAPTDDAQPDPTVATDAEGDAIEVFYLADAAADPVEAKVLSEPPEGGGPLTGYETLALQVGEKTYTAVPGDLVGPGEHEHRWRFSA